MTQEKIDALDSRLEEYFQKHVPASGIAGTLGGEIVRAAMRLVYRWYNDGDKPGVGYGNVTCNSSNRFLDAHVPGYNDIDGYILDGEYENDLYENVEIVLEYLDSNPALFDIKNEFNSRVSSTEDEMRERESYQEEYEYDY